MIYIYTYTHTIHVWYNCPDQWPMFGTKFVIYII